MKKLKGESEYFRGHIILQWLREIITSLVVGGLIAVQGKEYNIS